MHSAWQRELNALGGKANLDAILPIMRRLCEEVWAQHQPWFSDGPLSGTPPSTDPGLLNSAALAQTGRTTAFEFDNAARTKGLVPRMVRVADDLTVVVLPRTATMAVPSQSMAEELAEIVFASGSKLEAALVRAGLLTAPAEAEEVSTSQPHKRLRRLTQDTVAVDVENRILVLAARQSTQHTLRVSKARAYLEDVVCVFVPAPGASIRPGWNGMLCTCVPCLHHTQCEHIVFVESLDVPTRAATRSFEEVPCRRPGGRPKGSYTTPRGKAKAAGAPKAKGKAMTTKKQTIKKSQADAS